MAVAALAGRSFAPLQYLPRAVGARAVLGGCGLLARGEQALPAAP